MKKLHINNSMTEAELERRCDKLMKRADMYCCNDVEVTEAVFNACSEERIELLELLKLIGRSYKFGIDILLLPVTIGGSFIIAGRGKEIKQIINTISNVSKADILCAAGLVSRAEMYGYGHMYGCRILGKMKMDKESYEEIYKYALRSRKEKE